MQRTTIREWAEEDRPREKLMIKGASALSDSELLAILIGSGNDKESAVELSKRILQKADNDLNKLGRFGVDDLVNGFRGIGLAKAITIKAALELGTRRRQTESKPNKISTSRDIFELLYPKLVGLNHEEVWLVMLNMQNSVTATTNLSKGGIADSMLDVRLALREALANYASAIILVHNHPSGNCTPSRNDIEMTRRLRNAANIMDIKLYDHVIICGNTYYSFSDEGLA